MYKYIVSCINFKVYYSFEKHFRISQSTKQNKLGRSLHIYGT